ncbi:MAG TPA: glycosyltransferase family 4 protein [Bryobacteraceae bacterium]|nr:glycosyltransferase family 4 protein [Bryobacteraceae bacterium]
MKILYLCDFGSAHGGAEIATLALRDGLRARGHQAMLLSSSATPSDLPILADYVCFGTTGRGQMLLETANPSAWFTLRRVLHEFQPDVVHVSMFLLELSPLILPLLRDTPSLYHVHWLRPICPTGTKLLPSRSICTQPAGWTCHQSGCLSLPDWTLAMTQMHLWRRWSGVFHRFVTPSEFAGSALESAGLPSPTIIPNGVAIRPARPALSDPPTAFFCGRLVKEKGIDVLLKAWFTVSRRIPSARLIIAGDGPDRPLLEKQAQEQRPGPGCPTPGGVEFLGHIPYARIEEAACNAWLTVVPSVCVENFTLVAVESLMRGTAVIASRVGGLPELVADGESGVLVEPNRPDQLAEALVTMLGDRARCESMGRRGREVAVRSLSMDAYLDRFVALYAEMRRPPTGVDARPPAR